MGKMVILQAYIVTIEQLVNTDTSEKKKIKPLNSVSEL